MRLPGKQNLLHLALLLLFLLLFFYCTVVYAPSISRIISNPEQFSDYILGFGSQNVLVFILFQVVQVIIAAIPGELLQIAGGFVYGTWWGSIYSLAGILLGSIVAFYISRLLGYPLVCYMVAPQKLKRFSRLLRQQKSEISIFILFLIPGLPKDVITYVGGLTPLNPFRFLLIAIIARFPGILGSAYLGASVEQQAYKEALLFSIAALLLFLAGLLLKDRLFKPN